MIMEKQATISFSACPHGASELKSGKVSADLVRGLLNENINRC
jgi:hypothetical protein